MNLRCFFATLFYFVWCFFFFLYDIMQLKRVTFMFIYSAGGVCAAVILLHEVHVCPSRHLISRLSPPASPRGEAIFGLHCGAMLPQPHRRWDFTCRRQISPRPWTEISSFRRKVFHFVCRQRFYGVKRIVSQKNVNIFPKVKMLAFFYGLDYFDFTLIFRHLGRRPLLFCVY